MSQREIIETRQELFKTDHELEKTKKELQAKVHKHRRLDEKVNELFLNEVKTY